MPELYSCADAWYCLKALPKKEHLAATMLRREARIDAFAPRIRFTKRTSRGKVQFVEPLFPGYVFAHTALSETYRRVMAIHGIRGVVTYGSLVPVIPKRFIAEIRTRLASEHNVPIDDYEPQPLKGHEATVTEGPFMNWHGIISGVLPSRERVSILLELLGQQLEVELPRDALLMDTRESPAQRLWKR